MDNQKQWRAFETGEESQRIHKPKRRSSKKFELCDQAPGERDTKGKQSEDGWFLRNAVRVSDEGGVCGFWEEVGEELG